MKKKLLYFGLACAAATAVGQASAMLDGEPEGKAIFLEQKCNTCHSIESQGIEARMKKMNAPDLSNASRLNVSTEWLEKFLHQEELKDGKKHLKKFSGNDKELATLVDWIKSLEKS